MIIPEPADLQDLVRDLHRSGSAWLPAGLASRLDWGAEVRQPCSVVSAAALRGIREHSPGDFIVRVGAGTPLLELQQQLALHRQWLAVDPPLFTAAGHPAGGAGSPAADPLQAGGSIGGLVARGLAGGYRQRYLGVRDQVIGIRILRADGVEAKAGGKVVKNVAGYDLMRLFTGSWGSLGLITELTLRTMPLPQHRAGLLLRGPVDVLLERAAGLLRSGLSPERLDLWSPELAAAAGLPGEAHLLVALASVSAGSLQDQRDAVSDGDGAPGRQDCTAAELDSLLASARPRSTAAGDPDPAAWLLRLGALPSRLADLLNHPALQALPVDLAAGAGLGMAWAPAQALNPDRVEALRRRCRELGGHLAVLRQPRTGSAPLPAWEDAPSRALIEAVKSRFDPDLQLAPGRLPGVASPGAPLAGGV